MQLDEVVRRQKAAETNLEELTREFERNRSDLLAEIDECRRLRANAANGIDLDRLAMAEQVVYVHVSAQSPYGNTKRLEVLESAIADISRGAQRLRYQYFGIKNYAGFGDQREDHMYNFGPSHGSIVFEVGLQHAARKRLAAGGELNSDEINACLYYLENIKQGNVVKKQERATRSEEVYR